MTAAPPYAIGRINKVHDRYGQAWGIILYSGREDEHQVGVVYATYTRAELNRDRLYEAREIEEMDIAIARWDRAGEFWTYDY